MSSRAVRQWFRAAVLAKVPTVPYYETVNRMPDPTALPDVWVTLEFANASEQRLTLGKRAIFREFGIVNIVVLGLSGKGDEAPMLVAEMFRTVFENIVAQVPVSGEMGELRIDAPEPPNTDATESGNWFLASVSCSYQFDVVRG